MRRATERLTDSAGAASTASSTIEALTRDPKNRRSHPERNIEMIAEALRTVGPARAIVIDEHGVVLAGNGVIQAAAAAGITRLRIVDADGTELVAVRRQGLSEDEKRALALYDNRTAELAEWDVEQLTADAEQGLAFRPFWTAEEEAELLKRVPTYGPASEDEQGRLDQQKQATCPQCGATFVPTY